jgi:hypothetical protein
MRRYPLIPNCRGCKTSSARTVEGIGPLRTLGELECHVSSSRHQEAIPEKKHLIYTAI